MTVRYLGGEKFNVFFLSTGKEIELNTEEINAISETWCESLKEKVDRLEYELKLKEDYILMLQDELSTEKELRKMRENL
jgi:hypothetical protein